MTRKIEIAEEALSLLESLCSAFKTYDASLGERYSLMGRNLSATSKLHLVNEKISALLPERSLHLEKLHAGCELAVLQMKSVLDISLQGKVRDVKPNDVARLFARVIAYHDKMLPYEVLSLVEEARKDTSLPVLQASYSLKPEPQP